MTWLFALLCVIYTYMGEILTGGKKPRLHPAPARRPRRVR